jgi:predicted nucleic acid-binding Zn ribbon protein
MEKKVIPHCMYCEELIKAGQKVCLSNLNQITHTAYFQGKKSFIKAFGTYELIVAEYPQYFEGMKV